VELFFNSKLIKISTRRIHLLRMTQKRRRRPVVDNTRRRATIDDDRRLFVALGIQLCVQRDGRDSQASFTSH